MKWYIITGCYGNDGDIFDVVRAPDMLRAIDSVRDELVETTEAELDDVCIEQVFECDTEPRLVYSIP